MDFEISNAAREAVQSVTAFLAEEVEPLEPRLATGSFGELEPTLKPGLTLEHRYRDFVGRFMMSGDIKFEDLEVAAQYWGGPVSLDTHYGWELGYRDILSARGGFDIGRFTAGGGVDVRNITIDFAYLHQSEFDDPFRVSAAYRW